MNRLEFTLSNAIEGDLVISTPDNWKGAGLTWVRHPELHSVQTGFKTPVDFIGDSLNKFGGRDYFLKIERTQGPDAVVSIRIRFSIDEGKTWQVLFTGESSICDTFKEKVDADHRVESSFIDNSFIGKFLSRFEIPIDILSALNLDGGAATVYGAEDLMLPSQKVRYNGKYSDDFGFYYEDDPAQTIMVLDWPILQVDDLAKFTLDRKNIAAVTNDIIIGVFAAPYDGNFRIQAKNVSAIRFIPPSFPTVRYKAMAANFDFRVRKLNSAAFVSGTQSTEVVGNDSYLTCVIDKTYTLRKGEQVAIYGVNLGTEFFGRQFFGTRNPLYMGNTLYCAIENTVLNGPQVIDGGVGANGFTVLLPFQDDPAENGLWLMNHAGAWTRAVNLDTPAELNNAMILVNGTGTYQDTFFAQTKIVTTLGIDPIEWVPIPGSRIPEPYTGSDANPTYLEITGDTTFEDSATKAFQIHDMCAAVVDRIVGINDSFRSPVMGSPDSLAHAYPGTGVYSEYMCNKPTHTRGFTLAEKPMIVSMRDIWNGINPIFNYGIGERVIDGASRIYVGKRSEFYPTDRVSVRLSHVSKLQRDYDTDYIYNLIDFGYQKWQGKTITGIDDPQSNRSVYNPVKRIGKRFPNLSTMVAASLLWEEARRKVTEKNTDWDYDNDIFILNVKKNPDDTWRPALNEEFTSVTGLLNADSRYNKKLTPYRNFLRWLDVYAGMLNLAGIETEFRFSTGEGNFDMESTMVDNGDVEAYAGNPLSEKGTILKGSMFIHLPMLYNLEHVITSTQIAAINADKEAAIEMSQDRSDYKKYHIKDLTAGMDNTLKGSLWGMERIELKVVGTRDGIFSDIEFTPPFD